MSRQAKVRMADVLIGAGYNIKKVLRAVQYPALSTLTFHGFQNDLNQEEVEVDVNFIDSEKGNVETTMLRRNESHRLSKLCFSTITSLEHNGIAIFSFAYGRPSALLSSEASVKIFDADGLLKNKMISTNNRKVPIVPGWPTPMVLID